MRKMKKMNTFCSFKLKENLTFTPGIRLSYSEFKISLKVVKFTVQLYQLNAFYWLINMKAHRTMAGI